MFFKIKEHEKSRNESCQMCPIHIEMIIKLQKQLQDLESSKISGNRTPCQTCTMYVEEILKLQNQLKESSTKISRLQKQLEKSKMKWENALNTVMAGSHIYTVYSIGSFHLVYATPPPLSRVLDIQCGGVS